MRATGDGRRVHNARSTSTGFGGCLGRGDLAPHPLHVATGADLEMDLLVNDPLHEGRVFGNANAVADTRRRPVR